jgi:beta-lactamase class D
VEGSVLIFDPQKQWYYSNDFKWAETGKLPASTFKIPNSIIALESGVVKDHTTLFKWKGEKRRLAVWEKDMNFREAFHLSCVPCYQEIARKIGSKRMQAFLKKFEYGNMVVDSNTIDVFWLEGDSKISQFQQIDFLKRFYDSKLPISPRTEKIMKELMVIDSTVSYTISGKTGWSIRNGNNNGWFVGYIEKGPSVWFFATNVEAREKFNMEMFPMIRKEITMNALKVLKIIQ